MIHGEAPMTSAEVVAEIEWLSRSSASAAEMKVALHRNADSLADLCRDAGRPDLARLFYVEVTLEEKFESTRPKVNRNQRWSDEEFAAIAAKGRALVAGGLSVNAAAKELPFSRSYLRDVLQGLKPRALTVSA